MSSNLPPGVSDQDLNRAYGIDGTCPICGELCSNAEAEWGECYECYSIRKEENDKEDKELEEEE